VNQVRASGWEGVAETQREGVGRPAEPSPPYRAELQAVFDEHPELQDGDAATRFARFVEAQTVWDRAMAEAIARFRREHPATLVVGILGAGHVRHGHGVPHQLKALGTDRIAHLVTLPSDRPCAELTPGLAEAVYVVPPRPEPTPPRLGVSLKDVAGGVMIEAVMPGSLAQRSGLRNGDIIVQAAGSTVSSAEDVRGHVQRQPAGTSLPLLIQRAGWNLEIVVRFPADPDVAHPKPGIR
jgi:membrane-associated protease RseP (regulator of RpoE activity)